MRREEYSLNDIDPVTNEQLHRRKSHISESPHWQRWVEYRNTFNYKHVGVLLYKQIQEDDDHVTGESESYFAILFRRLLTVDRDFKGTRQQVEQAVRDFIDTDPIELSVDKQTKAKARQERAKACGVSTPPHVIISRAIQEHKQAPTIEKDAKTHSPQAALRTRMAKDLVRLLDKPRTAQVLAAMLSQQYNINFTKAFLESLLRSHPNDFASTGDSPLFWYHLNETNRKTDMIPISLDGWCNKLALWAWQKRALEAWESNEHMGVVEAVTGTGKTRVGIAAAAWCASLKLKTLILVPTADLQRQWRKGLTSTLPRNFKIGLLGDDNDDTTRECDILVATVQSAYRDPHRTSVHRGLIIADECHRYGAETWSQALKSEAYYRLGLTATYERQDDGVEERLDPFFGAPCYRVNYEEALRDNIIAHFKIALVGVQFSESERIEYDRADAIARDAQRILINYCGVPASPFGVFIKEVSKLAKSISGPSSAGEFLKAFTARRSILAEAQGKLLRLKSLHDAIDAASGTIVFTQTKEATKQAVNLLNSQGLRTSLMTSDLGREERAQVLDDFDTGETVILVAPKLLDEGIDVPEADLGIIVAASRTRLQMIQRMGRVLRKKDDGRLARVVILYVKETSEDPDLGAHEAFLDLVTPVANDMRSFSPSSKAQEICAYLNEW
jgi:superfamily II DNA or RNA helicase